MTGSVAGVLVDAERKALVRARFSSVLFVNTIGLIVVTGVAVVVGTAAEGWLNLFFCLLPERYFFHL